MWMINVHLDCEINQLDYAEPVPLNALSCFLGSLAKCGAMLNMYVQVGEERLSRV